MSKVQETRNYSIMTSALLTCSFLFLSPYKSYGQNTSQVVNLTSSQQAELKKIQQETSLLKQELNKQVGPTYSNDPKDIKPSSTSRTSLSSAMPNIYRTGLFYVTLDGNSFGSALGLNGHTAMVLSKTQTLEAWGNQADKNGVRIWPNEWDVGAFPHFMARSVNSTTVTQDVQAANRAKLYIGKPYNLDLWNIDQDNSYY
jgi:uncharacterized protein YycO